MLVLICILTLITMNLDDLCCSRAQCVECVPINELLDAEVKFEAS